MLACLAGYICWQSGHKDVAKLVSGCNSVIIQRQSRSEVPRGNVISVLVQHILALLVLEIVYRLLLVKNSSQRLS